jgi:hypothetical protein
MAAYSLRLTLLLLPVSFLGFAQSAGYPCQAPAEIEALTIAQIRARLATGQSDFFLYKQLEDLTPSEPKPGVLAPEFAQRLAEQPSDAERLYLYGRALIGKNSAEATVFLNRAAEAAPLLPWTYAALAEIYASANFRDAGKLPVNMRTYRRVRSVDQDRQAFAGRRTEGFPG